MGLLGRALRAAGIRRERLAAARMYVERNLLAVSFDLRHRPSSHTGGRILCYHSVGTPSWGVNDVPPADFRRQLEAALRLGYRFVPADEIRRTGGNPRDLAVTFDDGLSSVAASGAPILRDLGIPWALFVVSDWAEGRHHFGDGLFLGWQEIESLAASGVTIGSHSVSHPNFGSLPRTLAEHELFESRRVIEARTGIKATTFAIPFGQSHDWSAEAGLAARDVGYEAVYAQSNRRRPPGTVPRTFITRLDDERLFGAALRGAFDNWEEWF